MGAEKLAECTTCGKEFSKLEKCEYCGKLFCKEDYLTHMTWERRHKDLAEEEGKFWREHKEAHS
jgi:DNA-directed RNA polymerase subunit RPC12/RpoP